MKVQQFHRPSVIRLIVLRQRNERTFIRKRRLAAHSNNNHDVSATKTTTKKLRPYDDDEHKNKFKFSLVTFLKLISTVFNFNFLFWQTNCFLFLASFCRVFLSFFFFFYFLEDDRVFISFPNIFPLIDPSRLTKSNKLLKVTYFFLL